MNDIAKELHDLKIAIPFEDHMHPQGSVVAVLTEESWNDIIHVLEKFGYKIVKE